MSIDIKLKRADRVYYPGDVVSGVVVIQTKSPLTHGGIVLVCEGVVTMQLSAKSVGLFEAFYNSLKPVELMKYEIEIAKPSDKLPAGTTELPFEFPMKALEGQELFETYHGVYINIQYCLKVDMQRSMLAKNLQKTVEFIVELRGTPFPKGQKKIEFCITPESLENVKKKDRTVVPEFRITGHLDNGICGINRPFTGEVTVEKADCVIKSIEMQLVRVETCGCADGYAKEATEIQNIQIAEGDICRSLAIPIYMIFPRLFSCPTLATRNFKIEFEVNLVVLLEDGYLITENFPIRLIRPDAAENCWLAT